MSRYWLKIIAAASVLATAATAHAVEVKIATVAPDGSYWMRVMRAGGDRIREQTDGRVLFKFYPGGVMGTDSQVLRKIRVGQLQGGAFTAGGLAERYNGLNVYGIPLLFRSLDEVDYVRERLDGELAAGLEAAGFVSLGFSEGGFANLMSNEPVSHVDDLRRRKVWVPEGDEISYLVMESLGLSPVVLPLTDVLTGLQTGLLDVVFNSPVAALVLQWHTKVSYRTELPIAYSLGVFAVDKRVFGRLSAEDQTIVRNVIGETMARIDASSRQDNIEAEAVMREYDVTPVPVDDADVIGWRRTIESLYPEIRGRADIDADLFDALIELLDEYRSRASGSE
jgi:TRAP-type C4-dicarboxylate transport system substrate-binding protein